MTPANDDEPILLLVGTWTGIEAASREWLTMTTFFCPACFAEMTPAQRICPACGADVSVWQKHGYRERLIHALRHPLADVRMVAIDTLGRLHDPSAARPLAACAARYPHDMVQGVAIIHALAQLPRDGAWTAAIQALREHPVARVAEEATRLFEEGDIQPGGNKFHVPLDAAGFRSLIDDYARHAETIEALADPGAAAIMPLRRYLEEGPQVNPHGRLFAIDMLARSHGAAATAGLRQVLYGTHLRDLPAAQRDAEYQVMNAALRHLIVRDYPKCAADIAHGLRSERLPAAVKAVGTLRLAELAPQLAGMLDDDVLEQAAAESLLALGDTSANAIRTQLPAWLADERDNVRSRLAALRALLVLWRLRSPPSRQTLDVAVTRHPFLAAAVTLFLSPSEAHAGTLVRGAVSAYRPLAEACQERLRCPDYVCSWSAGAASALLRDPQLVDIYGNARSLGRGAHQWLASIA